MPNTSVPATAEGMPKFDMGKIMRDAWSIYRRRWSGVRLATVAARRKAFADALRNAWAWARQAIEESQRTTAQRAAARVAELNAELMRLDARPWGMRSHRTEITRTAILSQIKVLEEGAVQ